MQKILDQEIWEDMESPIFIYSSLAQSVERTAVNRDVVGSSPTRGANLSQVIPGFFVSIFIIFLYRNTCYFVEYIIY